jgi:HK97 gp10 family phage protein
MIRPSVSAKILKNDFGRIALEVHKNSDYAAKASAERLNEEYKRRVHVITGKTRESAHVERRGDANYAVVVGEGAIYEEFGTIYRPPHPTMVPAVEAERPRVIERFADILARLR